MERILCYLAPSKIHNIGVFASQTFSAGEEMPFFQDGNVSVSVSEEQFKLLDENEKKYCRHFGVLVGGVYYVPPNPHKLDFGWFLNHSTNPNLECLDDGHTYVALRQINVDEELTIDYAAISEDGDNF